MSKRMFGVTVVVLGLAVAFAAPGMATVYEVNTGGTAGWTQLQAHMTTAAGNPGDDEIRIREDALLAGGALDGTGGAVLSRATADSGNLVISGGWNAGATVRTGGTTTLDCGGGPTQIHAFDLSSKTTLAYLDITRGTDYQDPGAVHVKAGAQGTRLSHLEIYNNNYTINGYSTIYVDQGSGALIEYCNIRNSERNNGRGGAVWARLNSTVAILNCKMYEIVNCAYGGALGLDEDALVFGSLMYENTIKTGTTAGVAIYEYGANPTLVNVTVADNDTGTAAEYGMVENGGGTWQVRNSIFSDNELGFTGTGFTHGYNVYDELNYPTVSGGDGNQVADPLFTDRDNDDYTLGDGSPAIDGGGYLLTMDADDITEAGFGAVGDNIRYVDSNNNGDYDALLDVIVDLGTSSPGAYDPSTLAGHNANYLNNYIVTVDLAGNPRVVGDSIDAGAFEAEGASPIPEPAGLALLGFGLLGLCRRRRKKNRGAERSRAMGKRALGVMVAALAVALAVGAAEARADTFTWKNVTGDWNVAGNWVEAAVPDSVDDVSTVAQGTMQVPTSAQVVPGQVWVSGTAGVGGTVVVPSKHNGAFNMTGGLYLNGGKLDCTFNHVTYSFSPVTTAVAGTTSIVEVTGTQIRKTLGSQLTGSGDLVKTGTGTISIPGNPSTYTGTIDINAGRVNLTSAGGLWPSTITFGAGATINVNSGGTLTDEASSKIWAVPGGINLNGGTLSSIGNNGITYTASTTVTVLSDSTISTESSGFIRLDGNLVGSSALELSTLTGPLTLRGTANTYSGTMTQVSGSDLVFDNSGALPSAGALASLVIEDSAGGGSTVVDDDVDIILQILTIDGSPVASGVYDQGNPVTGVTFGNSGSSLEVIGLPPIPEPAGLAIIGLGLLGVCRRRRKRNRGAERRLAMSKRVLGVMVVVLALVAGTAPAGPIGSVYDPNDYASLGVLNYNSGTLTFDTGTGAVSHSVDGALGSGSTGQANQSGNVQMTVFAFGSIDLGAGVTINVTGPAGMVLASQSNLTFGSTLDLSGANGVTNTGGAGAGGPGGEGGTPNFVTPASGTYQSNPPPATGGDGGAGASGAGGTGAFDGIGHGGGQGATASNHAGAGGGYGGLGGNSGNNKIGGTDYGDLPLTDLYGGSGGGGGTRNGSGNYGGGAGGGGSLELVAVGSLIMSGTLDVSGGTGGNGDEPGGAGSGGGLILSAPSLDVTGGSILADGGDGGDGNGGWSYGGGGGGGGRVLFAAGSVTGLVDGVTVDVTGGLGGSRTNNASVGQPGLDGTFLLELEVAQPIPEPAGLAMIGFALLGLKRRKRNRGAERSCVMGKRMLGWIAVVGLAVALVAPAAFAVGHDVTADETETGTQTYDYLKWPSANPAVYTYTVSGAGDVTVGTGTTTDIEFEHGGTLTVTGGGQVSVPTAGGDLRTNTTDTNTVTINVLGTAAGPASLDIADYLYHNDDRRAKPLEVTVGGTSATNKGTLNMGKLYIERGSSEAAQAICNFTIQNHGEMTVDSGAYGQNDVVFDNLTTTTFTVDTGGALTFGQSDYAGTMGNVTFDVSGTFDLCDSDADPGLYPQLYAGNARQDQRLWLKIRDGGVTRVSLNNTRTTGLAGALLLRKQEARNAMAGIQMYGSSTLEIGRTLRFGTAAEPYLADEGDMFYFEDDSTVHFKCQNRWTDGDDRYEDSHHLTLYIAPQDLGRAADGWGTGPNGSGNFSMGNLVIEPNVNGDADVDFDLAVNGMTTPGLLYIETLKFVPGDVAGEEIRMDLKGDTLYVHDGVDLDGDGSWDITNSGPLALSATNWAAVGGIGSYSDYFLDGIGGGAVYVGELTVEPIPEPAGLGLIGLAMLGLTRRRR